MKESLEDVCVGQNFLHQTYHLRGVINEVGDILVKHHYFQEAVRLDDAMNAFGSALEAWAERLPDVEVEEIQETF